MNTISFSNAFKSLMATLGAKTTDSNYAVPLVNKTSGAPQGFMGMSNLASVLGVRNEHVIISANSSYTINKGQNTAVLFCWANTATTSKPAIILCGRNTLDVHVASEAIRVNEEAPGTICILNNNGNILVKNTNSSANLNFAYHLFLT